MREKPPILSDEQIRGSCLGEGWYFVGEWKNQATAEPLKLMPQFRNVAQAQRDADLKWFKEDVEKSLLTYEERMAVRAPCEDCEDATRTLGGQDTRLRGCPMPRLYGEVPPASPASEDSLPTTRRQEGGTMREQIDCILEAGVYGWRNESHLVKKVVLDQILAVVEPQMLTPGEANNLANCLSVRCYGKANWEAPLYLKLRRIAEGQ